MKKIISLLIVSLFLASCNGWDKNDNLTNNENSKENITKENASNEKKSEDDKVFSLKTEDISGFAGSISEDLNAKWKKAIKAVKWLDKPASMWHNKGIMLNEWNYTATFSLKLENPEVNEVVSGIYVESLNNDQRWYSKEIYVSDFENSKYNDFELEFKVTKDNTKVMPWVYYNGQATLYLDEINIEKTNKNEVFSLDSYEMLVFEEDELWRKAWNVVDDEMATNKKAVYVEEWKDEANHIAFGPYSEKELPWNHKAAFKIKTSDNKNENIVAKLEVFNENWNWVNKSVTIRWVDFEENNKYQNFELEFNRTDKWSMEYRVYYYGVTNLSLDNITIIWPTLESFESEEEKEEDNNEEVGEEVVEENIEETKKDNESEEVMEEKNKDNSEEEIKEELIEIKVDNEAEVEVEKSE